MIKSEDLIQQVRQLAQDAPTNLYEGNKDKMGCSYVKGPCSNGSVGCIIGQALILCDESLTEYLSHEDRSTKQFELLHDIMFEDGMIELSLEDIEWIGDVQSRQDDGETWGDAVSKTDGVNP